MLPDGGYVATRPTALQAEAGGAPGGGPSGNVARWTPESGESVLPETEAGYPNGVVADPDGRYIYVAEWTARKVRKYDLADRRNLGTVDLDFMPDNLTWIPDGRLLAAGISGLGNQGAFSVAAIRPETMTAETLYQQGEGPSPISGVSVAFELNDAIYVGAYQGDRIVRINR